MYFLKYGAELKSIMGPLLIGAAISLSLSPKPTRAQTMVTPTGLSIDGFQVSCLGAPTYLVGSELGDVAYASPGAIYINQGAFNAYSTGVKAFMYAHECGHVVYGSNENTADEFAIKIGRNQGWITPVVLNQICTSIIGTPGNWTHLPGPARCAMIKYYYNHP